jgi:hypothetical protein
MDRINFYQLLELQINPPENNAETIENAIKKKQSHWSRLRNHPTKGIQARHYISLLPEIRRVMTDSKLRQEEAQAAVEELKKRLESIFKAVDRHIDLIGSKGEVLSEEIARIAARHEIKPPLVQKRVERWQKRRGSPVVMQIQHQMIDGKLSDQDLEKIAQQHGIDPKTAIKIHQQLMDQRLAELDDFINIQVRKGYMTQAEISGLAAVFPFDEGEILRRIRCPIKKSAKSEEAEAHQLDRTVEQVIQENLKIVGKDSLYSFLGLFPGANLEALQKKAVDKENEIRKISQKDAFLTASGVLVGQCISLFKSDESRYAYDLSRARFLLRQLDADIDLAVTDNTIPRAQYNYLVRQAIRFGTLPEEAHQHIRDYCQSKGWKVFLPKKKINFKRYFVIAAIVLLVVGIGGGAFWFIYYGQQRLENEYIQMRAAASRKGTLEAQRGFIQNYIDRQTNQEYIEKAQNDIAALHKQIEYRDYKRMQSQRDKLMAAQEFEKTAKAISGYMTKHPQSAHNKDLKQELDKLPGLIDKRDYERIVALPADEYADLASAMTNYLRAHPKGVHVKDVNQIAKRIATPYYQQLSRDLQTCEKAQDWRRCIALSSPFIDLYKDSQYAVRLRRKSDDYLRNIQGDEILTTLRAQAGGPGADPVKLRSTYRDYLEKNPYSPAREMITAELKSLTATLNRQDLESELKRLRNALPQTKGRFSEKAPATVFDKTTGLTWAMIDSNYDTWACMTYEEAVAYVHRLKTGGYSDWRLPTAKELKGFYSGTNLFKSQSAEWYWSADKIKRYSGGWIVLVDVFEPANRRVIKQRRAGECGWVRPVRR